MSTPTSSGANQVRRKALDMLHAYAGASHDASYYRHIRHRWDARRSCSRMANRPDNISTAERASHPSDDF